MLSKTAMSYLQCLFTLFLQNAESSLQQKTEAISSFEEKTNEMMSSMKQMEER